MREPAMNTEAEAETMSMLVRGRILIAAGVALALLAGLTALSRGAALQERGESMSTTPHLVWAAIGAVVVVCGTVLVAAARVIGAIRADLASRPVDAD